MQKPEAMTISARSFQPDPKLDLVLQRTVDVPPELMFAGWTQPEHIVHWFTPSPWKTPHAELDLWPGGKFRTVMKGPAGEEVDNTGCILEVVPNERFAWTSALGPDYRPRSKAELAAAPFLFSALLTFDRAGSGTKYSAYAIHSTADDAVAHEKMGFTTGWGMALDQLVAYMKSRK